MANLSLIKSKSFTVTVKTVTVAIFVFFSACCSNLDSDSIQHEELIDEDVPDMKGIDVSGRDPQIFAIIGEDKVLTKSSQGVTLEQLIDRDKARAKQFDGKILTEIPFLPRYSNRLAALTEGPPSCHDWVNLSVIKMSLLDWYDTVKHIHFTFVVTMIPEADFSMKEEASEDSFIESLGCFRGVLLFSKTDGSFISCCRSANTIFDKMLVYRLDDAEIYSDITKRGYLSFPSNYATKVTTLYGGELEESFCFDVMEEKEDRFGFVKPEVSYEGGEAEDSLESFLSEIEERYGGGGSQTNTNKAKATISVIEGKLNDKISVAEDLKNYVIGNMMIHVEGIPLLRNLIADLGEYVNKLVAIEITDGKTRTVKFSDGTFRIEIRGDIIGEPSSVNMLALYEELLHVLQYCSEGDLWKTGDKELEAKIMLSILQLDYQQEYGGLYSGIKDDYLRSFYSFYTAPGGATFNAVVNSLYSYPFAYTKTIFPLTPDLEHLMRFKHLKKN